MNLKNKNWVNAVITAVLLILIAYFSRQYEEFLKNLIGQHPISGLIIYVLIGIIDAIAGPGISLAFIPVAARIWGVFGGALLTTVGWAGGSIIAFILVRHYGPSLIERLTSMEKIERIKKYIPHKKYLFWGIVLLRLALPMDVFSYALGLLTDVDLDTYAAATIIGVAPSAVLLSYLGKLPASFEIASFAIGGAVFIWLSYIIGRSTFQRRC